MQPRLSRLHIAAALTRLHGAWGVTSGAQNRARRSYEIAGAFPSVLGLPWHRPAMRRPYTSSLLVPQAERGGVPTIVDWTKRRDRWDKYDESEHSTAL